MSKKLEKKEQRALRQRVHDIFTGALGEKPDDDFDQPDPRALRLIVTACSSVWQHEGNAYLFMAHNIDEYADVAKATDFLYQNGVRA